MNIYPSLLHAHSGLRWLNLLAILIALVLAFSGWLAKRGWSKKDNISGLLLVIFTDVQCLVGIVLYLFFSPFTQAAFNDFGAAMKNQSLRFYAVEHIFVMIVALALIHIGRHKSKKEIAHWKRHRVAALFYVLALIFILAGIPWNRGLI